MKNKKLLLWLLIGAMLAPTLVACGGGESSSENKTAETTAANASVTEAETTAFNPFEGIPEGDFKGYDVRMLIRPYEDWIADMYVEEATGEVLNDAVFERNSLVGERYNVSFSYSPSSSSNYETDAVNTILAGDDAYDIIVPHMRAGHVYANQNLVLDWNTKLPNVRLDKEWWSQDCVSSFSINHKLYVMLGDISWCALGSANCMIFNKAMFKDRGLTAPYADAAAGTWTWDKWAALTIGAGKDVNGDGKMDIEKDEFGYVTQKWLGPIQVFTSSGLRVCDKDKNDIPYLSYYSEKTVEVFNKFFDILLSNDAFCDMGSTSYTAGYLKAFIEERALFADMNMVNVRAMREMDADFGVIPWPKWQESDEYMTNVDGGTNVFVIPITMKDPEMLSTVLEALAAVGYDKVIPAFYEVTLKGKGSRDSESEAMLDIVRDSRILDLGYNNTSLGGTFANEFETFADNNFAKGRDIASHYAENKDTVESKLKETLTAEAYK